MDMVSELIAVIQQLNRDYLAIELVKSGLSQQENKIKSIPLFNNITGKPVNKWEFKDIGSAGMIINQVSAEALISLVANSIETFSIRLKRHLNMDWEPFKNPQKLLRFYKRPCQFRALNNVFKHQEGYIESISSRSAQFLVSEGYFQGETYLKHMPFENILPNFELAVYETYAHLFTICSKKVSLENSLDNKSGSDLINAIKELIIYSIIRPVLNE